MKRLIILALFALVVTGCSSDGETAETTATDVPAAANPNAIRSDLPDDFPVPVPDGGEVQTAARQDTPEGPSFGALIKFEDGRYDELVSFYDDYTADLDGIERIETSAERDGVTWRNMETGFLVTISQTVESVTFAATIPPGAG